MAITGELSEINLLDFLQVTCQNGSTCLITVSTNEDHFDLFVENGEIVHAQSNTENGEAVFYKLIAIKKGKLAIIQGQPSPRRTIHTSWGALILNGYRFLDENETDESIKTPQQDLPRVLHEQFAQTELQGAVVIDRNGKPLAQEFQDLYDVTKLGAVIGGVLNLSQRSLLALENGELMQTVIFGSDGSIVLARINSENMLAALVAESTSLGMALWEINKCTEVLTEVLSSS